MKKMLTLVLMATSGLAAWAAPTAPKAAGPKRLIVSFKPGATAAQRAQALKSLGAKTLAVIKSNGTSNDEFEAMLVESSASGPVAKPLAPKAGFRNDIFGNAASGGSFTAAEEMVTVEEDVRVQWIESAAPSFQAAPLPSFSGVMSGVPRFQHNAAVSGEIPWGVRRVKAPAAWDTTEGKGVKVAVIDTGIKANHPELDGQVVGGYSAIDDSEAYESWQDDNGHGTHVAGTIAAKRDGKGVVGVAPKAKLYGVKVLDADGSGNLSDVIKGIIWAANNNIQVANMSLGSPMPSETMHRALRYAKGRSMVVVAAAGNSGGSVGYPGAYPETIAVSAADYNDKLADFSSRGAEVDFIAPGVDVVSTWPNNNTVSLSGTSMAAPHVAGLAALAVAQGARGLGGPDGVMSALKKSAKTIGLTATEEGAGMPDAGRLIEQ